jgi:mono/diheme cytochrome c family protein
MRTLAAIVTFAALSAGSVFAADAAAGKAVYNTSCKGCHGPDGTPNPAVAKMMKVDLKPLGSPEVQATSDADIKALITNGKGKMKAFPSITGASLDNVVAYVRSLKK